MTLSRTLSILLVEDDEIDAEIVQRAFQQVQLPFQLVRAHDGVEALNTLRGAAGFIRISRPYLIFLDLNLPRMNGIEFLQALRQDPDLSTSIVFVLTTSVRPADMLAAYNQHIAGYFLKSTLGASCADLINLIYIYDRCAEFPTGV